MFVAYGYSTDMVTETGGAFGYYRSYFKEIFIYTRSFYPIHVKASIMRRVCPRSSSSEDSFTMV
jgi:hypothetical protein